MTADLDGLVCLWRLPGGLPLPERESESIREVVPSSPVQIGAYKHKDWVRCLAEIDGVVISCCKAGEVRCAATVVSSLPQEGHVDTQSPASAVWNRRTDPGALVVRSTWHLDRPEDVQRGETRAEYRASQKETMLVEPQQQQAFGVAVDQSGIVVGCQDRSIRQYWFSRNRCVLTYTAGSTVQ